ncbi:hypothetical protein EIP86_010028, partial [Pleurotus ostreatoroseus]
PPTPELVVDMIYAQLLRIETFYSSTGPPRIGLSGSLWSDTVQAKLPIDSSFFENETF